MKKITVIILSLLLITKAYAGTITYTVLSGDQGLSYTHMNDSFETVYDEVNGGLDSDNIEDDSLDESTMADEINPRIRTDEIIGSYTDSGMLPATSTDLTSNISAGTSYVNGFRIVTAATSKTYTASKDTWVYIDQNGAFQYSEVATGAAQPTTPSNSLLLAQVVCDGDNITSVVDKRTTTPPSLRIYQDMKLGAVISRDATTATTINILRGTIDFGSGIDLRRNTLTADIDFTSTGRGGLDTGSQAANTYYGIWAVPDDGNATNYEGVASTSFTATALSITGERLIGWCYSPTTSVISPDSVGAYRGLGGDAPNFVKRIGTSSITTTSTTAVDMADMWVKFYSSGRPIEVTFNAGVANDSTSYVTTCLSIDTNPIGVAAVKDRGDGAGWKGFSTLHWAGTLGAGTHDIKVRWYVAGNTGTQDGTQYPRVITVKEL